MAKNVIYNDGDRLAVACTDPATPASGDPVLYGQRPGVALTSEGTDGLTSVDFKAVPNLSVKAIDGSGNSAVAEGDIIYYVSGDTPKLSKKATGVRFGYAMGAVTSAATATIPVKIGY
ncbi:MAG: capsid cement protein [Actinoallomurus sp.]